MSSAAFAGLIERFSDAERQTVAYMPHFVVHQDRPHRPKALRSPRVLRHEQRRQRTDAVRSDILARHDKPDARRLQSPLDVDRLDPRMGAVRIDNDPVGLPGQLDVVEITCAACEKSPVLDTRQGLTEFDTPHFNHGCSSCCFGELVRRA